MATTPTASIIIPSWQRPNELAACLDSLKQQTRNDYEIIVLKERGPLAALRNQGLRRATGSVVCFIDDDTICTPVWLQSILEAFNGNTRIVGVSTPAIVTEYYRRNRDILRFKHIRWLYDRLFVGRTTKPGHLTYAGTFVPDPDYTYEGEVQFLEACNMSFQRDALLKVGGFDEKYEGIGDWSEPDVCYRLRANGGKLWFTPQGTLYHQPSRSGAYALRKHTGARLSNYRLFASRWVKPTFRHYLYLGFLQGYYGWKELSSCFHFVH